MLRVTNTDNLMGMVIHGDYKDLCRLRESLARINDLYYDNLAELYSLTKSMDGTPNRITNLEHEREYFLSLNYDIRHAYMGERNYELEDNLSESLSDKQSRFMNDSKTSDKYARLFEMTRHGNLQYSVEILYPFAIYYMYAIRDYLNEIFLGEFPDNITVNFKEQFRHYHEKNYVLYQDIGILILFYGLMEEALTQAVGINPSKHIFTYINESAHTNNDTLYPEALASYYCNAGKSSTKQIKKAMIIAMAYELYDCGDELGSRTFKQSYKDYLSAVQKIDVACKTPYPKYYTFHDKLYAYVSNLSHDFYQEDFDEFLKQEYNDTDEDSGYEIFETDPWPKGL